MTNIRGPGLTLGLNAQLTNEYGLAAGETMVVPAGQFVLGLGLYCNLEVWDSVLQNWRIIPGNTDRTHFVDSDGVNWRVANRTGCAAGAVITNHGSGYSQGATCVASAGGSKWSVLVGGMIATSLTGLVGGSGYTYPPRIVIVAPTGPGSATPGIQATATCTISGGAVNAVTVTNQGSKYAVAPAVTFVSDPRDPSTNIVPATASATLTGSGQISGLLCTDPGTPQTSVPTLTITDVTGGAGASAAATTIMCFSVTGYTLTGGGTGMGAGTLIVSGGGILTSTPADTNPAAQLGIILPRQTKLTPALSGAVIVASATTAPITVEDWGWGFQVAPALIPIPGTGLATAVVNTLAATVGGQNDTFFIQPL